MFDLSSYEIPTVIGDAIDAVHKPAVHSSYLKGDYGYASDDIDLIDDELGAVVVDDASREDQIPHRQMMACEMSEKFKLGKLGSILIFWGINITKTRNGNFPKEEISLININ